MMKSIVNLSSLLTVMVQPTNNFLAPNNAEMFHFLKAVASEELDRIDNWESDLSSDSSDIEEVSANILVNNTSPISSLGPRKTIKKPSTQRSASKKTSKCKGITRSDKINFARWRWGKKVLSKDGSVIALEEETEEAPILRSTQCLEYLVIRNTGRPSTMCRKCYEINRTLQYGLRDMKRGKLGKKKLFSTETLISA